MSTVFIDANLYHARRDMRDKPSEGTRSTFDSLVDAQLDAVPLPNRQHSSAPAQISVVPPLSLGSDCEALLQVICEKIRRNHAGAAHGAAVAGSMGSGAQALMRDRLPLVVAGKLLELEFIGFGRAQGVARAQWPCDVLKTLKTKSFGEVRVAGRAEDSGASSLHAAIDAVLEYIARADKHQENVHE